MKNQKRTALFKLLGAQAGLQGALLACGVSPSDTCLVVSGLAILAPLFSQQAQHLYMQALPKLRAP